jgi:hypothetical protein
MGWLLQGAPVQIQLFDRQLDLTIRDGMTGSILDGQLIATGEWETKTGLKIKIEPSQKMEKMFCKVIFSVPSDSRSLHRLTVEAISQVKGTKYFFDGFEERTWNSQSVLERNTIMETFPLAAAWNHTSGMALGLSPDSMVSYMHNGLRRTKLAEELFYITRVVADARREQEITFCAYPFKPEFGWRNAVDDYYSEYAKYFKPTPGIDERIYGIGGYFISTHITRDLEIHSGRQLNMGWEWTYCPWVMAGNWYVDRNDWKNGDGYMHWATYWKRYPCTFEEYQRAETKRFESGNRQAAMFFYILVKDIGKELVNRYPESRRKDHNNTSDENSFLFSLPDNKNKTYLSFAYGTGLASYLEKELREAVENYQISGFALDMANWGGDEYCDAQMNYAIGRSFDEQGHIYTADSILPIPFAKYIHTLKKGEKTMGVYMNHALEAQPALPIFYSDAVMFEGNPEMQIDNFKALRLMSGQKPMTFWNSIAMTGKNNAINWNMAQQPEIRNHITQGLAQYLLFNCLRYGISPMNWAAAYQDGNFFRPWLSTIIDLKKAGWQVVPAIKFYPDVELWYGRFGSGADTIFTITNPTNEPVETKAQLINSYLGDVQYIPKAITGQQIEPQLKGITSEFAVKLQPKEIMVLRNCNWHPPMTADLLSPADQITGFFSMADAKSATVTVVAPDTDAKVIYDYLDRYYPYVQACLDRHGKAFTREPGMLNPKYDSCWRLPLQKMLTSGKQIAIGTPGQFPELVALLTSAEQNNLCQKHVGFIKVFPKQSILWISGNNVADIRKASDKYFELMDQKIRN